MKRTIITIMLIAACVNNIWAQSYKDRAISYLICIDDGDLRNIESTHVKSMSEVAECYNKCIEQELDTTRVFRNGEVYFMFRTENVVFYCEKKKVVFKKNGKIVYRTIKRKEKELWKLQSKWQWPSFIISTEYLRGLNVCV